MSGYPWTADEVERIDKCIELGVGPIAALPFFPNRTRWALHTKMAFRRDALGVTGKTGRPAPSSRDALRELERLYRPRPAAKFVLSTALVKPPKPYTGDTLEADASRELLRRQLQTGMHNITDPARYVAVCQSVGLVA